MFRITLFCEDKRLADVLHAVAGIVRGQPEIVPVTNVAEGKGGVKAASNGKLIEMFAQHLRRSKADAVTPGDVKAWLQKEGKSASSYSYVLSHSVSQGVLGKGQGKTSNRTYPVKVQ